MADWKEIFRVSFTEKSKRPDSSWEFHNKKQGTLGHVVQIHVCRLPQTRLVAPTGSLSNSAFWATDVNRKWAFCNIGCGWVQNPGQIVLIREKKLSNTNFLASRHIKEEKASLPVDVHRSKSCLLRVPNVKTTVCKVNGPARALLSFSSNDCRKRKW